MKKILASLAMICVAGYAFGQGQVNFQNTSTTLTSTNTLVGGPATGVATGVGGSFNYYMFWAPSGTTDPAQFTVINRLGTNIASAGRFLGGAGTGAPSVAGQPVGTTVNIIVRGWSANVGADWASAQAYLANPTEWGFYGQSGIATVILGGGATPVPNVFGTLAGQVPGGMTLGLVAPIPEPSSFALAGLGAAALLIFRRRK